MTRALAPNDREHTAARLLASSARHTLDPSTEVEWDAPLVPGAGTCRRSGPRCSAPGCGTLSEEQRIELSKHEIVSRISVGLWFEVILMQLLARYAYDLDLRRATRNTRSPRWATRPGTR